MKNFFRLTSVVLVLILTLLCVPITTASAGDVEVVATADPTLLFNGETTHIEVTITNNSGTDIILDYLFADGQTDSYPGVMIANGGSSTFFMDHDVWFAGNLDYGFRVEAHYDGGQVAYSGVLEFWEDIVVAPIQPATTTVDFSVSQNRSHVKKGGEVTYRITAKNTGDVDYENFVVEYVEIGMLDAATFDLAQGESKTITYKVDYDIDSLAQFGYHFNYWDEGDYLLKQCPDYIEKMVYIIDPDMTVAAAADNAEVAKGGDAAITVTANNTGDVDFIDVVLQDKTGRRVGGVSCIDAGDSKEFPITFAPAKTDVYSYTLECSDSHGNDYKFYSNEITITVTELEPSPSAKETTTAAAAAVTSAMPSETDEAFWDMNAKGADSGGLGTLAIVLIVVVAVLLAAASVLVFLLLRKKKEKEDNRPTDKHVL